MIYTRTGDRGKTSIFGGKRISKGNVLLEAIGNIDELSSFLGLVSCKMDRPKEKEKMTLLQRDNYKIMAYLSGAKQPIAWIDKSVKNFEQEIDNISTKLPKLNRFIIAPSTQLSAWFHILRTITRRVERSIVRLNTYAKPQNKNTLLIIKYYNRLSDYFFILSRFYNKEKEVTV